jgi:hypothetical protein
MAETRSKPVRELPYIKRTDLIWLAAIIEGEGSFRLDKRRTIPYPSIEINMTDEDVIAYIASLVGNNYNACEWAKRKNPRHKVAYRVGIYGRMAVELMKLIRPWMFSRRREQIDKILDVST